MEIALDISWKGTQTQTQTLTHSIPSGNPNPIPKMGWLWFRWAGPLVSHHLIRCRVNKVLNGLPLCCCQRVGPRGLDGCTTQRENIIGNRGIRKRVGTLVHPNLCRRSSSTNFPIWKFINRMCITKIKEIKYPQLPIACNVFTPDHNIIKYYSNFHVKNVISIIRNNP